MNMKFTQGPESKVNTVHALVTALTTNSTVAKGTDLMGVLGGESALASQYGAGMKDFFASRSENQKKAANLALATAGSASNFADPYAEMRTIASNMMGAEAFSNAMNAGEVIRARAATIDLNTKASLQFDAAEKLYPTVSVGYGQESLEIPIDIAGVGNYNVSGNGHEAFEEMRPIPSILADSSFDAGDDLVMYPVCPTGDGAAANPNSTFFVPSSSFTPWDVSYDKGDLLGRMAHKTNYLKVGKINNIMSLSKAPGAPEFDNSDEIEASSMRVQSVLLRIKTKEAVDPVFVTLDTSGFANNALRPSNITTSEEKYATTMPISVPAQSLKLPDGTVTKAFKTLEDAGLKVFIGFELSVSYQRGTRTLSITSQPARIEYVLKDGNRLVPGHTNMPAELQTLITAQALEGSVEGIFPRYNHSNTNNSRYGITCVFAQQRKSFPVYRRQPISVKYPAQDKDTNSEVLNKLTNTMAGLVRRNMSHDAFRAADLHFNTLIENNGMKVVNINDDSSQIMPGQYFLTTTAINAKVSLLKEVSTLESKNTMENIQAVLVAKITDIITAIRVNSMIAAFREQDNLKEKYTVIAHSSLAPFLMTTGDVRSFGNKIDFEVVETNIDSQVGTMWVVPTSQTKDADIDIYGGMGICVAREMVVIEGQINQQNTRYRTLVTQPAYAHHSVCPVAGRLTITDIQKLLSDEGIIAQINKLLVQTSAPAAAKEISVEIPA